MTLDDVKYRMPDKCCGNCKFVRENTYGDPICFHLPHEIQVDYGGICDLYALDPETEDEGEGLEELVDPIHVSTSALDDTPKGTCADCRHSGYVNNKAMCAVDAKEITDTAATCGAWEEPWE